MLGNKLTIVFQSYLKKEVSIDLFETIKITTPRTIIDVNDRMPINSATNKAIMVFYGASVSDCK